MDAELSVTVHQTTGRASRITLESWLPKIQHRFSQMFSPPRFN